MTVEVSNPENTVSTHSHKCSECGDIGACYAEDCKLDYMAECPDCRKKWYSEMLDEEKE